VAPVLLLERARPRGIVDHARRVLDVRGIGGEEVEPVLEDGPAEGEAGRHDRVVVLLGLEEVRGVGVQGRALVVAAVAAVEPVAGVGDTEAAVELVRAAAGGHVDDTAGGAAELRLEAAALDLDLLHELERDVVGLAQRAAAEIAHFGSVDVERVLGAAGAADLDAADARAPVLGLQEYARRESEQRVEAAAALGQVVDLLGRDVRRRPARGRIDGKDGARHLDHLGHGPDHQLGIVRELGAQAHVESGLVRAESAEAGGDRVLPDRHGEEVVTALSVADRLQRFRLRLALELDEGAGHGGARVVDDRAQDFSRSLLRVAHTRDQEDGQAEHEPARSTG
jgi:hypothetical protein